MKVFVSNVPLGILETNLNAVVVESVVIFATHRRYVLNVLNKTGRLLKVFVNVKLGNF